MNSKLTFKPWGLSAGPSLPHHLSSFSCDPAALSFQANPQQLLKERGKMLLAKHPAHRAREGPAHSIKVTEQGRGQRHRGISGGGRPLFGFGLGDLSINLQLPTLPKTHGARETLHPGPGCLVQMGRLKQGGEGTDPRSPRKPESQGRRGGGKEQASLPSSLCTLQSQAGKGRSPGCASRL